MPIGTFSAICLRRARCPLEILRSAALALLLLIGVASRCGTASVLRAELDDTAITASVLARIAQDYESRNSAIKVVTDEGEVFLIGRAASEQALVRFEDYARRSSGVWSVINRLQLGQRRSGSEPNDEALRDRIVEALNAENDLASERIQVVVYDGEAFLIGRVSADSLRVRAVLAAQETEGVRRIRNHLKAGPRIF